MARRIRVRIFRSLGGEKPVELGFDRAARRILQSTILRLEDLTNF
jgi:hypothetical protein